MDRGLFLPVRSGSGELQISDVSPVRKGLTKFHLLRNLSSPLLVPQARVCPPRSDKGCVFGHRRGTPSAVYVELSDECRPGLPRPAKGRLCLCLRKLDLHHSSPVVHNDARFLDESPNWEEPFPSSVENGNVVTERVNEVILLAVKCRSL